METALSATLTTNIATRHRRRRRAHLTRVSRGKVYSKPTTSGVTKIRNCAQCMNAYISETPAMIATTVTSNCAKIIERGVIAVDLPTESKFGAPEASDGLSAGRDINRQHSGILGSKPLKEHRCEAFFVQRAWLPKLVGETQALW